MDDNSSLYDQFSSHEAPAIEQKAPLVREPGWQASNNERFKRDLPQHVQDSMTVTQADHSYYAFNRFAFGHPVRDDFEQSVNKQFGKLEKVFNFKLERDKYRSLYRNLMGEL
jgi:hypothetical protein